MEVAAFARQQNFISVARDTGHKAGVWGNGVTNAGRLRGNIIITSTVVIYIHIQIYECSRGVQACTTTGYDATKSLLELLLQSPLVMIIQRLQ